MTLSGQEETRMSIKRLCKGCKTVEPHVISKFYQEQTSCKVSLQLVLPQKIAKLSLD